MTNVLLAIDGPIYGKTIEDFVLNYCWVPGTSFKLVYAMEPLRGVDAWPEVLIDPGYRAKEKKYLEEVAAKIRKALPDVLTSCKICEGFAKDEIIDEAIRWPADMIVMGSHGRRGIQRFLMGSVSLAVTSQAPCTVVIIRLPKTVEQASEKAVAALLANPLKTPTNLIKS